MNELPVGLRKEWIVFLFPVSLWWRMFCTFFFFSVIIPPNETQALTTFLSLIRQRQRLSPNNKLKDQVDTFGFTEATFHLLMSL